MRNLLLIGALAALAVGACRPVDNPSSASSRASADTIAAMSAGLPLDMTTPEERAEIERAAQQAGMPVTPQSRSYFACAGDRNIMVRFFPQQGIAVLELDGQNQELNSETVASGYYFTNGRYGIRGGADKLELLIGRMAPIQCHIAPRDGEAALGLTPTVPPAR